MLSINKYIVISSILAMFLVTLVIVLVVAFRSTEPVRVDSKTKLVIDHDGGADDAMAIFMALLYEEYFNGPEVVALTTTHGNVGEEQVFINSQRILSVADRTDVPIYRGSSKSLITNIQTDYFFGVDGLGDNVKEAYEAITPKDVHAAVGLIELSKKYEGELLIVALGAMTNIALAIRLDPKFISRLSHLYVAAGNIYSKDSLQPEFNAEMDVESYYIVSESGTPDKITIVPFSQIRLYQKISKEWRADVLGTIPTKIMQAQNGYERISFNSSEYWCLLDPSAMAIALDSVVVEEIRYTNNSIILCGEERAINTNVYAPAPEYATSKIIYKVKKEDYQKLLIDIFSAELV